MVIKVLFFDTSALIKMFVDEPGTSNIKWLTSPETRLVNSLHFVVNEQVCNEFQSTIKKFSSKWKISEKKADSIIRKFNKHYKEKYFRVIGQRIISNTKKETGIDEVNRDLNLTPGKNDWDGVIYQSIINALASLGGESHPILVSCDNTFGKKVKDKGYRVINPEKQSVDELRKIINNTSN